MYNNNRRFNVYIYCFLLLLIIYISISYLCIDFFYYLCAKCGIYDERIHSHEAVTDPV